MEKKTIGSFIAVLRKSNGMTQQELADRLNVSNKTISKWECDDGYPDLSLIPVIAELFNVTSDEILKGRRINQEEGIEKVANNTKQQIKRLITNTLSKFKMLVFIAGALSLVGFIFLFIISYGLFRPYIGLGIFLLLIITSFTIIIINLLQVKKNFDTELLEPNDVRVIDSFLIIKQYLYFIIVFNIFLLITGIPIGVMGDAYSVVTFSYYLSELLPYLLLFVIPLFLISFVLLQVNKQKKYKDKLDSNVILRAKLRKINIIFTILSILILGLMLMVVITVAINKWRNGEVQINFGIPVIYFIVIYSITCYVYLLLRKRIFNDL